MADRRALRRTEAAVVLLGLTALAALMPVAVDGLRFHAGRLLAAAAGRGSVTLDSVASVAVTAATLLCLTRFTWAMFLRWRAQHRITRALSAQPRQRLGEIGFVVFPASDPRVFTTGFLRPAIYVSDSAKQALSADSFRAVLAHEASHVRRRDPLRLALGAALVDAFGWVPGMRGAAGQHATLAELAADADAVRSTGDARGLSRALLEMDTLGPTGTGVLPQRVDHLLGELQWDRVSGVALAASVAVLAGLSLAAIAITVAPAHPTVFCTVAALALAPVLMVPAAFAARRAQAVLTCR